MPAVTLGLSSERFSPSGGFAAEGMRRLLGAPPLSLLQLVVREAVQNSWDARRGADPVRCRIRLRVLSPKQTEALRTRVFAELPAAGSSAGPIQQFLALPAPVVMEICDWGTSGLSGPTRADELPGTGQPNNFVNFVRNYGVRRDTGQGGGTYGYGKSSLYLASGCATVIIDSLACAPDGGPPERRLIASHVGDAYDDARGRLTGRHWWGILSDDGAVAEPLTGLPAARLARDIGLPVRGRGDTGTSILVLAPRLSGERLSDALGEVQETLLWYFWPKLIDSGAGRKMHFELETDGTVVPLPSPEEFPPLDLFVEAYRSLKADGPGTQLITSERPSRLLGRLNIRRGFRNPRKYLVPRPDSIIPQTSAHIAVMRPVELVLRYIQGTALPSDNHEWAGLFICDDDPIVEQAFADAEPAAHDDWIPDMLPKGPAKTFVNVALKRLKDAAVSYAFPPGPRVSGAGDQPSLARAADRLGEILPTSPGTASGCARNRSSKSARRPYSVEEPSFVKLREGEKGPEAVFETRVTNISERAVRIRAVPGLVLDGEISDVSIGPDGRSADFIAWETETGEILEQGPVLQVGPCAAATCRVSVTVPDMAAVGVSFQILDEVSP